MIPYLLLPMSEHAAVRTTVAAYCKDEGTQLAVRSTLEELGDDFETIQEILEAVEEKGNLEPGLWEAIAPILKGGEAMSDWRAVPRYRQSAGWL